MLRDKTMYYYEQGYNCSQCLLKAAESVYKIPVSKFMLNACQGINAGFGVGGMCSVLVAGVIVLGLLFGEQDVKRLRMKFLDLFHARRGDFSCPVLIKSRSQTRACQALVGEIADILDRIIQEEQT